MAEVIIYSTAAIICCVFIGSGIGLAGQKIAVAIHDGFLMLREVIERKDFFK